MFKVIGSIMQVVGFMALMLNIFNALNSNAFLDYNMPDGKESLMSVGYFIPILISALIIIFGYLLTRGKEDYDSNLVENNH